MLKVFEGCTLVTRQLFEVLRELYEKMMLFKPRGSKVCNSERYVVAMGLRHPMVARDVARRLRRVIERCAAEACFVASLGVKASAMTHEAFDRMAAEQADAIKNILLCVDGAGRTADLRSIAAAEARDMDVLFRRLHVAAVQ